MAHKLAKLGKYELIGELAVAAWGASPNDVAVQKLLKLVQRDQEKQRKLDRLQHEWEELKKLISTKKYPEVIARAEKLLEE